MDYAAFEYALSASLLVIAMIGMGATVTPRDFGRVARMPLGIILIVVMQVLISPLIAIGLARLFQLPPEVAIGLLFLAALPGGLFSNFLTYLGRGDVALSVSATALCTVGCLVTTSFVLRTFGAAQLPDDFSMPLGRILFEITVCLLVPLAIGMSLRRITPNHFQLISNWCMRVSLFLLGMVVVGSIAAGRLRVTAYGWAAPVSLVVFGISLVYLTCAICKVARLTSGESFAAAIEVSVRNTHLGLLLKASLFPSVEGDYDPVGDGILFVVVCYGAISVGIAISEVIAHRRGYGFYAEKKTPK